MTKKEKVNHPSHYNQGKYEVIDVICDWDLDFIEGNIIKYVARSGHKDNRLEDLKKARWYLDKLIYCISIQEYNSKQLLMKGFSEGVNDDT